MTFLSSWLGKSNRRRRSRQTPRLHLEQLEARETPSCSPVGSQFLVNTTTANSQDTEGYARSVARDTAGDFVVVINAEKVKLTGKKETDKEFMSYSGWKGGEKYRTVAQVRAKQPEKLIHHAVKGMIPKNRLGRVLLTKLKVYKGDKHPHEAQQPQVMEPAK